MAAAIQILRSNTAGIRPSAKQYGEPYVNFADNQFGVFDPSNVARDLLGVPFFSTALSYITGAPVNYQGLLYTANINISAGAWNPAQWTQVIGGGGGTSSAWTTGDVKLTFKNIPDTGWVFMDDGSIGDASSGATTRANSDTQNLFTLLYNNVWRYSTKGCTISIASPAVVTCSAHGFAVNQIVQFDSSGSLPTGITKGAVYYIISAGFTADAFQFSATAGGAAINTSGTQSGSHQVNCRIPNLPLQNSAGTTIARGLSATADYAAHSRLILPMTIGRALANAGPVATVGAGLTQRWVGLQVGEESHTQSAAELFAHSHTIMPQYTYAELYQTSTNGYNVNSGGNTGVTGSSSPFNVMQPTAFMYVMIKL